MKATKRSANYFVTSVCVVVGIALLPCGASRAGSIKSDVPTHYGPKVAEFSGARQFGIIVAGPDSFSDWFDGATAVSVLKGWLKRAKDTLKGSDTWNPEGNKPPINAKCTVITPLTNAITWLDEPGHNSQGDTFSYLVQHQLDSKYSGLIPFLVATSNGLDFGFLGLSQDTVQLNAVINFLAAGSHPDFLTENFSRKLGSCGIGDLTLFDLYTARVPRASEDDERHNGSTGIPRRTTGKEIALDFASNLTTLAATGFFSQGIASEIDEKAANGKCCCPDGVAKYHTCQNGPPTINCNTCGSSCCMLGVVWCALGTTACQN